MQITETLNSGLKREINVRIPAVDMEAKLIHRLSDLKDKVRIGGFRPGKIPVSYLRKLHGQSLMAEIINETLSSCVSDIISQRSETPAMQPGLSVVQSKNLMEAKDDLEFNIIYEVVPVIMLGDLSQIEAVRPFYQATDEDVDKQILQIAESRVSYEPCKEKASDGDRITIDYVGKIDGTPFEGGAASGQQIVIGAGSEIYGFEKKLSGLKSGQKKDILAVIPKDYPISDFAGREAVFSVHLVSLERLANCVINDETARSLGLESLAHLKKVVLQRMESEISSISNQKVKRQILDQLDEAYKFEVPSTLVEAEFQNIWNQLSRDLDQAGRSFSDEGAIEENVRQEYMALAERRVRLGLVLAEIGKREKISISNNELTEALIQSVRRYPEDQQKKAFEMLRSNEQILTSLRATLFEEKVFDYLIGQIKVTNKTVSKEDLTLDEEEIEESTPALKTKKTKKEKVKETSSAGDEINLLDMKLSKEETEQSTEDVKVAATASKEKKKKPSPIKKASLRK